MSALVLIAALLGAGPANQAAAAKHAFTVQDLVSLKRLGRTGVALVTLAVALPLVDISWAPAKVVLIVLTPLVGAAVFAALFVCAGAVQFWVVEGGEIANSFTYGGSYVSQYPTSVLSLVLRSFFTFVVPAAFVAYLPTLALLDLPTPAGVPAHAGWAAPLMAAVLWLVALRFWRQGVRHYTGAGG